MIGRSILVILGAATLLSAGAPAGRAEPPVQPANVGDLKNEAVAYYDSGAYLVDLRRATTPAISWIEQETPRVTRPAVVFDIDETALSNWEVIRANDFGRVVDGPCTDLPNGPCGWRAWDLTAQSTAIEPTRDVFDAARKSGATVVFLTGRDDSQRAATEANLAEAGYLGFDQLVMEPVGAQFISAADFKAPRRAELEGQGYTIIANIGDQPSDLAGGHAERTYLLPNPFYRIP